MTYYKDRQPILLDEGALDRALKHKTERRRRHEEYHSQSGEDPVTIQIHSPSRRRVYLLDGGKSASRRSKRNVVLLDEGKLQRALKAKAERKQAAEDSSRRREHTRESMNRIIENPVLTKRKSQDKKPLLRRRVQRTSLLGQLGETTKPTTDSLQSSPALPQTPNLSETDVHIVIPKPSSKLKKKKSSRKSSATPTTISTTTTKRNSKRQLQAPSTKKQIEQPKQTPTSTKRNSKPQLQAPPPLIQTEQGKKTPSVKTPVHSNFLQDIKSQKLKPSQAKRKVPPTAPQDKKTTPQKQQPATMTPSVKPPVHSNFLQDIKSQKLKPSQAKRKVPPTAPQNKFSTPQKQQPATVPSQSSLFQEIQAKQLAMKKKRDAKGKVGNDGPARMQQESTMASHMPPHRVVTPPKNHVQPTSYKQLSKQQSSSPPKLSETIFHQSNNSPTQKVEHLKTPKTSNIPKPPRSKNNFLPPRPEDRAGNRALLNVGRKGEASTRAPNKSTDSLEDMETASLGKRSVDTVSTLEDPSIINPASGHSHVAPISHRSQRSAEPSSYRSQPSIQKRLQPVSWSVRNEGATGFKPNQYITKETMTQYTNNLGGVDTVATTTKHFYDKAIIDPQLKSLFEGIRWEHVRNEFIILANLEVPNKFDENLKGVLEHHCKLLDKGVDMDRLVAVWESAIESSWLEHRMDDARQLIVGPSRVIFNLKAIERHYAMYLKAQRAEARRAAQNQGSDCSSSEESSDSDDKPVRNTATARRRGGMFGRWRRGHR